MTKNLVTLLATLFFIQLFSPTTQEATSPPKPEDAFNKEPVPDCKKHRWPICPGLRR